MSNLSKVNAHIMELSIMWALKMAEYPICKYTYEELNQHRLELRQFLEDILAKERARNESPSPDPTTNT